MNDYQFSMPIKVRDYEVDSQGIVNNAIYLHYLEHTRHEFCEAAGTSFRAMSQAGIDPVVRNVNITYLSPLRLGETAISALRLRRQGPKFIFEQDMYRQDNHAPVVKAEVTIVSTTKGRLLRGDELAAEFAKYL